jgi:hypothetical protein
MMRAEFEQANVAGDAAVISCPGFEHALRIVFVIDFGENPAVSVVDEKNDHLQALPLPGISQSCPSRRRVNSIAWASVFSPDEDFSRAFAERADLS